VVLPEQLPVLGWCYQC